jgi:hypothetical protein
MQSFAELSPCLAIVAAAFCLVACSSDDSAPPATTISIEPLAAGGRQVTLYRRWDDWNEPNDPIEIASEMVAAV